MLLIVTFADVAWCAAGKEILKEEGVMSLIPSSIVLRTGLKQLSLNMQT